jgi:hypothetical protein
MLEERISVPADFFSRLADRIEGLGDFLELETSSRSPNACLRPSPLTDNVEAGDGENVIHIGATKRLAGFRREALFYRSFPGHCDGA